MVLVDFTGLAPGPQTIFSVPYLFILFLVLPLMFKLQPYSKRVK